MTAQNAGGWDEHHPTVGKWVTTAAEKRKKKQAGKPDKGWKENERRIYQSGGSDAGD